MTVTATRKGPYICLVWNRRNGATRQTTFAPEGRNKALALAVIDGASLIDCFNAIDALPPAVDPRYPR